jgi:3',5'-cyclic AMP phosphodiesterase CpdA
VPKLLRAFLFLIPIAFLLSQTPASDDPFVEKPYLQLGDSPKLAKSESLSLMWHTGIEPADWKVELRTSKGSKWRPAGAPLPQAVLAPGIAPHLVYRARLTGLVPGEEFQYRVLKAGSEMFTASARARKSAAQPQRFILFGDCAEGTPGSRSIAYQVSRANPDFVFIPGDIVYTAGRISEYRDKFYPVYNADSASTETGAPLLRSVPFIAAPGNHDTALANFGRFADSLAYFFYWDEPLNGPVAPAGAAKTAHLLTGNTEAQAVFRTAAGKRYPGMANFSFDYGNAHWLVLDSNPYMDWTNPALREWVDKDLAAARNATWRFVSFHHPGFNSSKSHFTDQWMRVLSPAFEQGKVDIVFAGHVHNYQRSYPFTFSPLPQPDDKLVGPKGEVAGAWKLDKAFGDGAAAKPQGIIYIVSGGGGAGLYNPEQQGDPSTWQPFTYKYIADQHSFSQVEIDGRTLRLKQISETGVELDSFQIAK